MSRKYVVCGYKPWNREVFDRQLSRLPGEWRFIGRREELTREALAAIGPRYVFFLHWSWRVPAEIVEAYECVNFHMTDLPYGRGGSPLQNLIARGKTETVLTAHRMVEEVDSGPVYLKRPLGLEGSAEEILRRADRLAASMIRLLVEEEPEPAPQQGEEVRFARRSPAESEIPGQESLEGLYDFIRMLDAEGYPRAFLRWRGWRYEFGGARLDGDTLRAEVVVSREEES